MKKLVLSNLVVVLGLCFFMVLAIGSTDTDSSKTEKSNNESKKSEVQNQVFKVNDEVSLGDNVLIVKKVEKSSGSDFDEPKDGMEFVVVTVNIKNKGNDNISYDPFNFKLQNSKGQIADQAFSTIDSNTSLNDGELVPNGEVEGTIVFEAPKDDPKLTLLFEPSFWSSKQIKIELN